MADRKATNKYYPPKWTPDKGSLNTFLGSHPLRERARKLDQGIMVIRFELPYNIWCGGCGSHVGMGVRYNAEKSKVGNYYSTPIFKFRMKCHLCDNYFEIQTDPKNMDYVVTTGASRKNEKWEHTEGETVAVGGKTEAEKLASDPMYRLEHNVGDEKKAEEAAPRIAKIVAMQQDQLDDFSINQMLRKKFREEKRELKVKAEEEERLKEKASISIPLLSEHPEDVERAHKTSFTQGSSSEDRKRKRLEIKTQSLFGSPSGGVGGGGSQKKARMTLLKACSTMDSSIFSKRTNNNSNSSAVGRSRSASKTKLARKSLGIRTE